MADDHHNRLPAASGRFWLPLSVAVLAVSAALLFFRLGHYPLWADEADTALYARGIARTGDTYAVLGHNVYAFRDGACLKNLRGRFLPPASLYLAAPFVGTHGTSSFWPRVPFALCGLSSIAVMLFWMSRSRLPAVMWVVVSLGILGNVSFFLFCRQCRYFALAILLSMLVSYFYLTWGGRRWKLAAMMIASVGLLLTNYLSYAALYAAIGCDYFIFRRRERQLFPRDWWMLLVPQVLVGVWALSVYNPLGVVDTLAGHNLLLDKLKLFWWNLRDLNASEFGVAVLLIAAPLLYFIDKNVWLLRGSLALLTYIVIVTIFSPQEVGTAEEVDPQFMAADVRYLVALIPLCIAVAALSILTLSSYRWEFAIPLAAIALGTNILIAPSNVHHWRCTTYQWLEELSAARETSISEAIDWLKANIKPGQSVIVAPNHMNYPLMYAVPEAVYGWQLKPPPQGQFKGFPPIHFMGVVAPDYIVGFGRRPVVLSTLARLEQRGDSYTLVKALDVFWDDMTRPELLWRSFQGVAKYDHANEAVYIWRRNDLK